MDTDSRILLAFVRSGDRFVSGSAVARELGLSRVSVHNHLEALREQGFSFEAIRNRGYRLVAEPEAFHPAFFRALLADTPCPFLEAIHPFDEVGSTNDIAATFLADGKTAPLMVIAAAQSRGRGRRGRVWHSPRNRNLYLSLGLRPRLPPTRLQTVTLSLGLAVCRFLRDQFGLPVLLKWPNDLMLHDRKIAGMLTEARVDAELTRDLVFGIGLNANTQESDFPPELRGLASSLAQNLGRSLVLTRLAHSLVTALAEALASFLEYGPDPELPGQWNEFDYLQGRRIHSDAAEGLAQGISSNGSLRVRRDDGSLALLHSGEVTLNP
jgi:BirA family biotin operon repressor/biotin-[acetyl-CoA-carboxylase] ligase